MHKRDFLIEDRKIRLAVVGCGRIAAKHVESANIHNKDIDLVAVCDNDSAALNKMVSATAAKGYDSIDQMLDECKPDLVAICTPSGLHPQQVLQCAASGCHVMTEKPMATRWDDGVKMVRACDDAGVKFFVVKQNRHNPTLELLKKTIKKGRFGRIYLVHVNVLWSRPQSYYDSAAWRGTWEFDGGALMNQASHYVDLLDWLIGPVESVQSMIGTLARNIEVEDTAVLNIRWRSGAMGTMCVTMLTYPRNLEGSITIIGEKGTVKVGGVAVNEIQHWEFADSDPDDEKIADASYETSSVYGLGHPRFYSNVIGALRGTCKAETDGREGLRSLELLIAAYLSAREGRRIALPLNY